MAKGFIYIMTNPALKDMVKIGYALDVEARVKAGFNLTHLAG